MRDTLTAADLDRLASLWSDAESQHEWCRDRRRLVPHKNAERDTTCILYDDRDLCAEVHDNAGLGFVSDIMASVLCEAFNALPSLLDLARKGLECDADRTTYLRVLAGMAGERDALAAEVAELRDACKALLPLVESVNRNGIPDQVPLGIDIERLDGSPTVGDLRRIAAALDKTEGNHDYATK